MKSNTLNMGRSHIVPIEHGLSRLEKYVLRRFHPRAIFIDSVGMIWFFYFLWLQNWQLALASAVIGRLLAITAVLHVNPQKMSETVMGKIAMLHLHPVNLIVQMTGFIVLIYGVWMHSTEYILLGLSAILLGHYFSWGEVSAELKDER